ncbi:MAG: FAD-dependent oxidoreductase [Desulfobacteraceae bacterium]|nr:FAD-dependent oxidoreductase [Desulfobacteraceae bacterium]
MGEEIMNDILFSSWGGRVVDNRGKEPQAYEPADHVELPEYFKQDQKIKALLGWDGIIIRSEGVDIIDFLRAYLEANLAHAKTCDKCNYCKTGWEEQLEVFEDIYNGEATEEDLEFLESSAEAIVDAGKCTIGKAGPVPVLQALKHFADDFSQAVGGKKPETGGQYHAKLTAPCTDACPIHLDIPKYVELIKDAKFADSLDVIRERLPLPGVVGRICVRPCEDHCRRSKVDEPISIMSLKRFVADQELSENKEPQFQVTPSEKTGKVAIIGAGPAGMTCAYHLALQGHQVTVFEKLPLAGGMVAVGIPQYSLPPNILVKEMETVEKMGVTIKFGIALGEEITLDSLKADGFQAIFLGVGLHGSRQLGVEGEDLEGVISGIEFLRHVALGKEVKLGKRVIVVGGGNVAVDVARTAIRLGAGELTMVCLESREEMPAWSREIEGAIEEKVEIVNAFGPKVIQGKDGKVTGVEFKRCTRVFDENNRFNPQYDETDVQTLSADTVILAIGQSAEFDFTKGQDIPTSPNGGLQADPITFQSELKWVFAGGDAVYGPQSVVEAAASGKKAALGIDRFINNLPVEPDEEDYFDQLFRSIKVYDPNEEVKQKVDPAERKRLTKLSPESRVSSFDEVEQGFSSPDAVAEAERCLRCYRVVTLAV